MRRFASSVCWSTVKVFTLLPRVRSSIPSLKFGGAKSVRSALLKFLFPAISLIMTFVNLDSGEVLYPVILGPLQNSGTNTIVGPTSMLWTQPLILTQMKQRRGLWLTLGRVNAHVWFRQQRQKQYYNTKYLRSEERNRRTEVLKY